MSDVHYKQLDPTAASMLPKCDSFAGVLCRHVLQGHFLETCTLPTAVICSSAIKFSRDYTLLSINITVYIGHAVPDLYL